MTRWHPMRHRPLVISLVLAGLLLLVLGILAGRKLAGGNLVEQAEVATGRGPSAIAERCASQRTYDRVKTELFRRAAVTRGSAQSTFDQLSAYSAARVERPLLADFDENLGTIRCTGRLSLDLPPDLAVVGGRRTLSADIDYVLQPAADGSGDVVILEGADPIVLPLATLARAGNEGSHASVSISPPAAGNQSPGPQLPPAIDNSPPQASAPATEPVRQAAPPAMTGESSKPSFNCRYARTGGERTICNSPALAALDRRMAAQYYAAVARANREERRILTVSRDQFLRARDRCGTEACIANSYHIRMREIREIMQTQ